MNKEYIERESLIEDCDATISNIQFTSPYQDDIDTMVSGMERIRDMIDEAPVADVAPVVHGEWIPIVSYFWGKPDGRYYCSECRQVVNGHDNFCSNCGAKMDGGNE